MDKPSNTPIWKVPKIWDGGECWILGGGPSLPKQFGIPNKVIDQVTSGQLPPSTYSPYLELLHNKNVIGINAAYMIGNWIKVIFFGDPGFFDKHKEGLAKFPNLKITCAKQHPKYVKHNIKILKRYIKRKGISKDPSSVCWNGNSGAAAISVAANMGVKRVYLLGFDMQPGKDSKTHWHNVYKKRIDENVFQRHLQGWPVIAKDAEKLGIEIINVSPESRITHFPRVELKDVL